MKARLAIVPENLFGAEVLFDWLKKVQLNLYRGDGASYMGGFSIGTPPQAGSPVNAVSSNAREAHQYIRNNLGTYDRADSWDDIQQLALDPSGLKSVAAYPAPQAELTGKNGAVIYTKSKNIADGLVRLATKGGWRISSSVSTDHVPALYANLRSKELLLLSKDKDGCDRYVRENSQELEVLQSWMQIQRLLGDATVDLTASPKKGVSMAKQSAGIIVRVSSRESGEALVTLAQAHGFQWNSGTNFQVPVDTKAICLSKKDKKISWSADPTAVHDHTETAAWADIQKFLADASKPVEPEEELIELNLDGRIVSIGSNGTLEVTDEDEECEETDIVPWEWVEKVFAHASACKKAGKELKQPLPCDYIIRVRGESFSEMLQHALFETGWAWEDGSTDIRGFYGESWLLRKDHVIVREARATLGSKTIDSVAGLDDFLAECAREESIVLDLPEIGEEFEVDFESNGDIKIGCQMVTFAEVEKIHKQCSEKRG